MANKDLFKKIQQPNESDRRLSRNTTASPLYHISRCFIHSTSYIPRWGLTPHTKTAAGKSAHHLGHRHSRMRAINTRAPIGAEPLVLGVSPRRYPPPIPRINLVVAAETVAGCDRSVLRFSNRSRFNLDLGARPRSPSGAALGSHAAALGGGRERDTSDTSTDSCITNKTCSAPPVLTFLFLVDGKNDRPSGSAPRM
jgi:hypothetical protein